MEAGQADLAVSNDKFSANMDFSNLYKKFHNRTYEKKNPGATCQTHGNLTNNSCSIKININESFNNDSRIEFWFY